MKKINLAKDVDTDIKINITGVLTSSITEMIFIISKYGQTDVEIRYSTNGISLFDNYVIISIPKDTLISTGLYSIRLIFIDQSGSTREFNLRGYGLLVVA